ncbi:MAG: MBL fold metallo-hydrolase [Desulfobulbus sp.]|nr:MAG: MBL fold metallo-hydrolase [Desulfobulbus sp.]RUM37950.1 MAG: MBL fold metallo-hydrolase [Desulfobulbus sp.]
MKLEFHGADRNVTGSCHMVRCQDKCILIDCGMYQGGRDMDEENRQDFGFNPGEVDIILLTHGHLDHCGRIPLLVKKGFRGKIVATAATRELARLVMLDSARIQEEEAKFRNKKLRKKGKAEDATPLYTTLDALTCLDFFYDITAFNHSYELGPGMKATYYDAGHILGAASILLELSENGRNKKILYSGDLGYSDRAILRDPAVPPHADIVVMETTYGNRVHKQLGPSIQELYDAIEVTVKRGGNVLIPSFALERTQEILYYLREGIKKGLVKENVQVFLDSPMAISATEIFQRHPECFDEETWKIFETGEDPFELPGLHYSRETAQSIALKQVKGAVIIAGSGMATGGRIRHHLQHNLWRKEASVVFVGYAANGTLARQIIDGKDPVRIYGKEIDVRAEIYTIGGFSAHADQEDLLAWHAQTGDPEKTFLVHGELESMEIFAGLLKNTTIEIPKLHQAFEID